ncbi:hypothetical protein ACFYVL_00505 [Streptomyces sp. NPDC004111]|uniref:hypothetical protein n=1 Tax=Streptomyces sp. NPDC004111 TaxID=3364690 RepID=UPI0036936409
MTDTVNRAHRALSMRPLSHSDEPALLVHLRRGHLGLLLAELLPRLRSTDCGTTRWESRPRAAWSVRACN